MTKTDYSGQTLTDIFGVLCAPAVQLQPRIGDPNRDIAIAQALTQQMAQRGLAALSIALETAEASKPPR